MDGHIFTRYSRFSKYGNQVIATPVADSVDFKRSFEQGPVLKFKVPRKGDLIKEIMLHIKLSDIDEATLPYIGFTSPFPFYMFQKIDLVVGDTIIETLTPDYMLYQLYTTNNQYQNDGYAFCVGNVKALIDNTKYGSLALTREDENLSRDFKREFTFPLPFYFHKVISSAIPLCALTKQEVEVHFHMRGLYNFLNIIDKDATYVFSNNNTSNFKDINERGELTQEIQERLSNLKIEVFDVLVDFVYIDDSTVEKIQSSPVSFFINQSQLRRFENEKGTRFGNPYLRHRLDFINPIKDIFFYLVKSSELYQDSLGSNVISTSSTVLGSYDFVQKIIPGDTPSQFGATVKVSGDTFVAGAPGDATFGSSSGAAYVYTYSGGTWSQQQKLTASDAQAGDFFGESVSIDGDTIIVGARGEDTGGNSAGAAYVFVRSGGVWTEQQKLIASDAQDGDFFGGSVSSLAVGISGDTAVIGAFGEDAGGTTAGAAYVFVRSGVVWSEQQKLTASDAQAGDYFGTSVGIDGSTIVIGASGEDDGGSGAGAAYVFVRSGVVWSEQQKLTSSDAQATDIFGGSVSINGDTVVVGAGGEDDGGSNSGAAYVFVRSGGVWTEQQKLTASDAQAGDSFGISVDVNGDTVVVGASGEDDGGSGAGAMYVFTRTSGVWSQYEKIVANDATAFEFFGRNVSISDSHLTASTAAPGDDHVYTYSATTVASVLYSNPYVPSHRFTLRQGGYKFGHTVKNCEIIADNSVLLSNKVADYNFLNQIQPFISHTMTLKPAISFQQPYFYTYSFALDPENNLPTGYFNPNAYKNVELNITYNTDTLDLVNDRTLFVYARSINILTISDGVSELLFENPQLKEYY